MKPFPIRRSLFAAAGALALFLSVQYSAALEMRTWLSIDGRLLEAELVRVVGDKVELRKKDGAVVQVPKSALSFGDLDYVAENAPADKTKAALGSSTGPKPKLPNPAKDVKIDKTQFKKEAGDFKINSRTYRVFETPHFKIMYMKPTDPGDLAELGERLWLDTAFFHSTFIPKWSERKMAVILVNDQEAYEDVGSWFADMLASSGNKEGAARVRATFPKSASSTLYMPPADADAQAVFAEVRVFRTTDQRRQTVRGVWDPFRTHTLASSLLDVQAGNVTGASPEGSFAIFTGHAFYKEIQLTGRSETNLIGVQGSGNDVGSAGGFKDAKDWAPELKKLIRKEPEMWGPEKNIKEIWSMKSADGANTRNIVFTYAFSRFLQSAPERLSAYNRLCEKIDVSNQVPTLDEIGKLYGYESEALFIKAWVAWMDSSDFR